MPGVQATCPAFGGADLQTLYVTSAAVGLAATEEAQGATFETRPGETGQAESQVILG